MIKDCSSYDPAAGKVVGASTTEPVAQVVVDDQSDNASDKVIDAKQIIAANCAMCHEGGLMGAPKIGSEEQWAPRIAQGKETLVSHAINGIRTMPAKGGNAKLSDEEVAAAVIDMANGAGANF